MNWINLLEIVAVLLNLSSMLWNIISMRKSSKAYGETMINSINKQHEMRVDFMNSIDQLQELYEEEIHLLKTNEGLYDLRNNPEQYKMYLKLLSDGRINRGE